MKLKLALAAAAVCMTNAASAATLTLEYNNSAAGYETVDIGNVPVAVAGNDMSVLAGGFNMTDTTPGGFDDFVAWCLDLGAFLGTNSNRDYGYETTTAPFQNGGYDLGTDGMNRVADVFNANFGDIITTTATLSAAFQLALWEVVYDDDFNLSDQSGDFTATSSNTDVITKAQEFLDAAFGYGDGPNLWELTFLESDTWENKYGKTKRAQNLVTAAPSPVPLPATGLMLLAGLGGLVATRRKKIV